MVSPPVRAIPASRTPSRTTAPPATSIVRNKEQITINSPNNWHQKEQIRQQGKHNKLQLTPTTTQKQTLHTRTQPRYHAKNNWDKITLADSREEQLGKIQQRDKITLADSHKIPTIKNFYLSMLKGSTQLRDWRITKTAQQYITSCWTSALAHGTYANIRSATSQTMAYSSQNNMQPSLRAIVKCTAMKATAPNPPKPSTLMTFMANAKSGLTKLGITATEEETHEYATMMQGLRRMALKDDPEQAIAMSRDAFYENLATVRDRRLRVGLWLAWKTSSRWDEMARSSGKVPG